MRDPTFTQYCTLDELFAVDTDVFMLASPHYGACGKVLNIDPKNEGRIRVCFKIPVEPQFDKIIQQQWVSNSCLIYHTSNCVFKEGHTSITVLWLFKFKTHNVANVVSKPVRMIGFV